MLNEYLEKTKIIYSAVLARKIDIFEEQLELRNQILDKITAIDKSNIDKTIFKESMNQINIFEEKIKNESEIVKKEILKKQNENKIKMSSMQKKNTISNKYKYGNLDTYQSTYIDKKK